MIVDEAGMVSGRQMSELFCLDKRNSARLIFSGDTMQIQSVEAADALRILEKESQIKSVPLIQVQRQTSAEYREAIQELRRNPERGHRAILPMSRSMAGAERADIELTRLSRQKFTDAVHASLERAEEPALSRGEGALNVADRNFERRALDDRKAAAEKRTTESGFSLTVYRRRHAAAGAGMTARWAQGDDAGDLVPLLLAGAWNESNENDKSIVAEMAGRSIRQSLRKRCRVSARATTPMQSKRHSKSFPNQFATGPG